MIKLDMPFLGAAQIEEDFQLSTAPFQGLPLNAAYRLRDTHCSYANIISYNPAYSI